MRILLGLIAITILSCNQNQSNKQQVETGDAAKDPHTFSQPGNAVVKHLNLTLNVDFATKQITGKAAWTIYNLAKGNEIIFDTKQLAIQKVTLGTEEAQRTQRVAVTFVFPLRVFVFVWTSFTAQHLHLI